MRGAAELEGTLWKWSFAALNVGLVGMVGALLVSGFAQAFVERAIGGSTHEAFIAAQENPWFVEGMITRLIFGLLFAAGYVRHGYRPQRPKWSGDSRTEEPSAGRGSGKKLIPVRTWHGP